MPEDDRLPRKPKRQRYFSPLAWIGSDVTLAALQGRLTDAAAAIGPVLITGEKGTGKRLGQDLLLRYCETGELRCLSTWFRPPPAQIVAATSVSLEAEARAGRFREGLLRVLMHNAIVLRPLRERPEDVLPIFTYYLDAYSYWTRRAPPAVPDSVRDELLPHQWAGNVDELKRLAARAVLTGSAEGLLAERLTPTPDWRELVELMWTDDESGHDPVTCGIYLSDRGLETFMSYRDTYRVSTNMITARTAAQELRRDFLLAERRYEEFASAAREW